MRRIDIIRNYILRNESERKAGCREMYLLALGMVQQQRMMDRILNMLRVDGIQHMDILQNRIMNIYVRIDALGHMDILESVRTTWWV
jgi:hypothetical protein